MSHTLAFYPRPLISRDGASRESQLFCVDRRMVTFCAAGGKGVLTAMAQQNLGYRDVATLEGGFTAWTVVGPPTRPVES